MDAPVEIGTFQESDFDEGGGHYRVVVDAEPADFDIQKMTSTLRPLVASATDWMKDRPYQTYLFIYHFPHGPAGGGMEHAYSTAIDINAGQLGENLAVAWRTDGARVLSSVERQARSPQWIWSRWTTPKKITRRRSGSAKA